MHRTLLLASLLAILTSVAAAEDLRIKVPAGMRIVVRQDGDIVEVSFVPREEAHTSVNADGDELPVTKNLRNQTVGLVSAVPASLSPAEQDTTLAATSASPSPAARNQSAGNVLGKAISSLNFDRPLAAAPAFVALDVTPETVTHPGTPREFAASLLNGVDRKGTLQTGLALEAAPYQVFFGPQTSLTEYRDSYLTRLLYNINLSLGTTKASTNDDKAQRLAFGMELTLFDKGDPRLDPRVEDLFHQVTTKIPFPIRDPDMSDAEWDAFVKAHYEKYGDPNQAYVKGLEEIRAASWGRTSWNVAWAPTFVSTSGRAGDLKYEGLTAWTTFAYGFEDVSALKGRVQFIAHLRYREGEEVADPNDATHKFRQDSLFAAGRLRWGRPDLNFSGEGAYIQIWNGPGGDGHAVRLGAVLEKKLSSNLWFVLSAGEDFGAAGQANDLFSVGSLRFGSADSPTFAP